MAVQPARMLLGDSNLRCHGGRPLAETLGRGSDFGIEPCLNPTVEPQMDRTSRGTASVVQRFWLFMQVSEVRIRKRTAHQDRPLLRYSNRLSPTSAVRLRAVIGERLR